jgi:hypothetical protein
MANYYYFAATLPALLPVGMTSPFTPEEFLQKACQHLNEDDYEVLASATLFIPEHGQSPIPARQSPLLTRYYQWDRALRNELARLRAQRLQRPAEKYQHPGEPDWDAQRSAQIAFAAENPLEAELLIEKERWAFIEGLATNAFFDLNFLTAYALKLQILARREVFTRAQGEASYQTVYAAMLKAVEHRIETGEIV